MVGNFVTSQDRITVNLPRYREYTAKLAILAHVPHDHAAIIAELKVEHKLLAEARKRQAIVDSQQKQAYDSWNELQTATKGVHGLWTKLKGRGQSDDIRTQQLTRERAYELAFTEGQAMLDEISERECVIAQLEEKESVLRIQLERREELRALLLAFYDEVFDGPTPGYPEEDAAEEELAVSREGITALEEAIAEEKKVKLRYDKAVEAADRADRQFGKAIMTERSRSHHISKGEDIYREARLLEKQIRIGRPDILSAPGELPPNKMFGHNDTLWERKTHAAELAAHFKLWQKRLADNTTSFESQLAEATKEQDNRRRRLEEVRWLIMETRSADAPPGELGSPVYAP